MAATDEYLEEASRSIFQFNTDEQIRKLCRDRVEYYQDLHNYERAIAQKDTVIEGLQETIENLHTTIAEQNAMIADLRSTIAEQNAMIADLRSTIAEQKTMIAEQNSMIIGLNHLVSDVNSTGAKQDAIADLQAMVQRLLDDREKKE